jgi:transposase-like protein
MRSGVSTKPTTVLKQISSSRTWAPATIRPPPGLASWLEDNIPEALVVFGFPASHRRRLRTTNGLGRRNLEIKRRARVATLYPNETSLLRVVSAVLSEISDDCETDRLTST